MMYAADFRAKARESLSGKWTTAVGTWFVAGLLGAGSGLAGGFNFEFDFEDIEQLKEYMDSEEALLLFLGIVGGSLIISLLFGIFHLIVGGAATLGYAKFNLNLVDRNDEEKFGDLFSQFHRLGTGIAMRLLLGIYTFLWSLLFLIPGIVKGYSYAMTSYILAENPSMSANEAITESRKLMDGNKWRLFCLNISFIGWMYLSVFTCGIGIFWLAPYMEASFAAFYREIKREKYGEPEYRDMSYYEINQEEYERTDEN